MITSPFSTTVKNNSITLEQDYPIVFVPSSQAGFTSFIKAGVTIGSSFFKPEKKLLGTEEEIIRQIHEIRYHAKNPYVITGGHFSDVYVRNLGIFFNALLDPRIPSSKEDWIARQEIVLKTVALDLEVFCLAKKDFTTIVPLSNTHFTAMNIFTRPSDSLFAILYTLCTLTDPEFILKRFPGKQKPLYPLMTVFAGKKLLSTYNQSLKQLVDRYLDDTLDKHTGLIKTNIILASARDGIKRSSSFYDNVIAWATAALANRLGIRKLSPKEKEGWKQNIIQTFWDEDAHIFLDDLSPLSKKEKLFSADTFIVISTSFLNPFDTKEKNYLTSMIDYVQQQKLDQPFPLAYSKIDEPDKLHWPVRTFAPSYMGRSIWSHWGMEYVKTLLLLSKTNPSYQKDAARHLAAYKKNIEKYGGYPELYNTNGKVFTNRIYKSVLHNGWVINYEQAKML